MARATRSSATASTTTTVKRKRLETVENDQPPQKQSRRDDDGRISTQHAISILDVLEMIDCQGLLDRVFPVLHSPETSSSLRTLLKQSDPLLTVIYAAVQHLFPISSLPRANPSPTAAQQLRFCNLAVSLFGQASNHPAAILSLESILPDSSELSSSPQRPLKYALVQHLPNQDYWTSLNSDAALTNALKTLPTAHAELVAVLPTPISPQLKQRVTTLGSYAPARPSSSNKPLPTHRTITTGAFLDYGPYAGFAPSFDQNAEVVGRRDLGLVLYASNEKKRRRLMIQRKEKDLQRSLGTVFAEPLTPTDDSQNETRGRSEFPTSPATVDLDAELQELFPHEVAESVKASIKTLELENAVHELLERNRRAIFRLGELQIERLIKEGEHSKVEEGSEEWDTAQGIMDTLTVLASLRPRTHSDKESPSIVPPPSILHKLHRTLALEPSLGWYGTLPANTPTTRPAALRDDITVKKSRSAPGLPAATAPANNTPAPATTPASAVSTTTVTQAAIPYSGYTYAYGAQPQQPYRTPTATANGATAAQTPTSFAQYTPQYYAYAPSTQGQQAQGQQNYYGTQQQGYAAYAGWYNAYSSLHQQQQGQPGTAGSTTPQPQVPHATYGSFFGNTGARTPVVANTVYAPQGQTATALPAHLRSVAAQGVQSVQQGYYAYQQPIAAAATSSNPSAAGAGR